VAKSGDCLFPLKTRKTTFLLKFSKSGAKALPSYPSSNAHALSYIDTKPLQIETSIPTVSNRSRLLHCS